MTNEISLDKAIDMTTLFRDQVERIVNPDLAGQNILPRSETFDRAIFDKILSQAGCVKIRVYSGLSPDLQRHSIVVGVNEKDEDMLPASAATAASGGDGGNSIGEDALVCPPICPPRSALNP